MSRASLVLLAVVFAVSPSDGAGQAVIKGVVLDSLGAPIVGATVSIDALNRHAETDAKGEFRLPMVTIGMRMVSVRRVGYTPFSKLISVGEGETMMPPLVLGRLVTVLDTVLTEEQSLLREDPLLREMADNMKIGLGQFVLRTELDKLTGLHISAVFRQRNGLLVVTDAVGHAWIASSRGTKSLMNNQSMSLEDASGALSPMNARQLCYPKVYLDNQPLSIRSDEAPEINRFRPENIEAIEIYAGASQTPARYHTLNSQCGAIVFHSRRSSKKPK